MFTTSHLKRKTKGRQEVITPPMTFRSRSSSVSSSSSDESYFFKTYVPLSSLPTPPPSSQSNLSSRQQSPHPFPSPGEILDPELLGPAIHLTNLIPSSTSLTTPSVPLVHQILTRANVPLETIALAVCILDSLNSRFALQWRKGCPLSIPDSLPGSFSPILGSATSPQHIDSIHPELISLSALILAVKFLDDEQQHTIQYAIEWAKEIWTCPQINYTQRCLLENLGYRLLPLWEESIILEALEDMERAGQQSTPEIHSDGEDWDDADTCFGSFDQGLARSVPGRGKAVLGEGKLSTPIETPGVKIVRGMRDVEGETRSAFPLSKTDPYSYLPDRTAGRIGPIEQLSFWLDREFRV
ncbi:uncharacterized protein RSE6_03745 [Rhynchosporium secalis]|uniref:Cyclin N-terminal domain-containing protein n=1 Tax=Rhynchosporium secalis TaxID=38038 RepID=A0A1E1M3J8_RHYSE|nr:uncharacterized protein RSE6_03745 [Rhynchosporium secalis]